MPRELSISIALAFLASAFVRSVHAGDCWCAKNLSVYHISQSECDSIGGTGYKTKEQALTDTRTGDHVEHSFTGLSNSDAFHTISAAAVNKFRTDRGYDYVKKFEDWISDPATHALEACGSTPRTNLRCDVVFLVAAGGHIQKMLFDPNNLFEQCVSKNFRPAAIAPKPPANSWPLHIRILDGGVPRYKGGDPPFLFFSNARGYRTQ